MTHAISDIGTQREGSAAPRPGTDPVVDLQHVSRRFGSVTALADLSLCVPAGSITVLVGPNGAGKTTALRVITGALAPDTGEVRVFGLDPTGPDGEEVRRRCGVVAAKPALYDRLSGRDNLRYAAELFGLVLAEAPIEEAAARFGIQQALDLKVGGYSTGMKTRLALARAVLHDPALLLLDEPTSGLDPESSRAVLELIHEMTDDGKTVVMSTHLLLEAEGLADQVVIVEDGVDVVAGTTAALLRRYWPTPTVLFEAEVARNDLRQLRQSPDFWLPMLIMAAMFFVVIPTFLLLAITSIGSVPTVQKVSGALDLLPSKARSAVQGVSASDRTSYALAVYLFAPLAVIVPLTISTAVGANTLVGEREKGTGEFLAHSPASEREIYLGKLIASLLPGYLTTLLGFGIYSLVVNLIVGPHVGGWFFPTPQWWVLMLWVVPPFLAITLSVVLRLSARVKSAAAAQQASGLVTLPLIVLSYAQSSGALLGAGRTSGVVVGLIAWIAAAFGLVRGARAVSRPRLLGIDAA